MSKEPQILRLNPGESAGHSPVKPQLTQMVNQVQSFVATEIEATLNKMLDSADDKLFDMADKTSEVIFFNSMRQLRIKRNGFITKYKQELSHYFDSQLAKPSQDAVEENIEELGLDSFSLLKADDLEENLAIDAMVAKARQQNNQALLHLETRLDAICPAVIVSSKNNPVDPKCICDAFRTASEMLDLDIECRLVVYKLFDRFVIAELPDIYNGLNNLLADRGIMPDMHKRRPTIRQQQKQNATNTPTPMSEPHSANEAQETPGQQAADVAREDIREEVFNTIRELLSDRKVAYQEAPLVDSSQLMTALTQLQNDRGFSPEDLKTPQQFKQVLGGVLPIGSGQVNGGTIGSANDDVIDIVSMMFDFILEDKDIHNDIKATLSRLQIPMLKVGLLDRRFFSHRNHPARKLLNEMARAGIGWSPGGAGTHDPLLVKIGEIVERVLVEFNDDIDLFESLLHEFEQFQKTDARRISIIEKRMREAEEGKAKASSARQTVNAEISRICHSRYIAEPVKQLLKEAWNNVLFLEHLKPDNQSGWDKALKVAEFLVWSVQPKRDEASKAKLTKIMPSLVKNLKLGMGKISFSSYRAGELLESLEACHRKLLSAAPAVETQSAENTNTETLETIMAEIAEPVDETTLEEIALVDNEAPATDKEPIVSVAPMTLDQADPIFEQVKSIQAGTWLELTQPNGETLRCKLAAYIASSDQYILVNRTGIKIADFNRQDFAAALKQTTVRILDDAALFDRALESVITNLRSMKG